jgi:hypothetical protein
MKTALEILWSKSAKLYPVCLAKHNGEIIDLNVKNRLDSVITSLLEIQSISYQIKIPPLKGNPANIIFNGGLWYKICQNQIN